VATNASDTTAEAPTDMTAAEAPNTAAKAADVAAAKASAPSSAASATATGIGCDGEKGNDEEQHRGNADAGHQHRSRILLRSNSQRLSRERVSVFPRTERF
jgi:hypothetical protein